MKASNLLGCFFFLSWYHFVFVCVCVCIWFSLILTHSVCYTVQGHVWVGTFVIKSSVEFAVCEVRNFPAAWRRKKTQSCEECLCRTQVLTKGCLTCARMQKMRKLYICSLKCMAFSVSILSHASVRTMDFSQVPWRSSACKTAELFTFFKTCQLNVALIVYIHIYTVSSWLSE